MSESPSKPPKGSISPVAAIVIIVVCVGGFVVFLMENAINTPLLRKLDVPANEAWQLGCETKKITDESQGIKNTEDCSRRR